MDADLDLGAFLIAPVALQTHEHGQHRLFSIPNGWLDKPEATCLIGLKSIGGQFDPGHEGVLVVAIARALPDEQHGIGLLPTLIHLDQHRGVRRWSKFPAILLHHHGVGVTRSRTPGGVVPVVVTVLDPAATHDGLGRGVSRGGT